MMLFKSEKALNFLLENGEVYTLRPRRRREGKDWIKIGRIKLADIEVKLVGEVFSGWYGYFWVRPVDNKRTILPLGNFVQKSGFRTVREWLEEVKRLNGGKVPDRLFLYHVRLLKVVAHARAK